MKVQVGSMMEWIERLLDGSLFAGGIFLLIGIGGAVLLIVSLVLDGIFDAFDAGDGPLSLTTIGAFTAIFGFAAFASVGAGATTVAASVVGGIAGLLGAIAAWWLSRAIRGAESTSAVSEQSLVGREGSVVLAIPERGLGEIAVTLNGERVSLSASADAAIPRGSAVRIVQTITSTSVRVERVTPGDPAPEESAPVDPAPVNDPAPETPTPAP